MKSESKPDLSPKTQHDQPDKGAVDKVLLTHATMREKDISRGAESATSGASGPR